jgi:hypothetical protein
MKNNILKSILLCTFFLVLSCNDKQVVKPYKAGVVLSFDDTYVKEWFETDKILNKYSWRATFCVCKINTLRHSEIKKLLNLQKEGHEIAGHGLHHYHAERFVKKYGIKDYLNQEINQGWVFAHHFLQKPHMLFAHLFYLLMQSSLDDWGLDIPY